MRILKETELRKVKVLGSGAFGTVYKVRGGAIVGVGGCRGYIGCSHRVCWGRRPRAGGHGVCYQLQGLEQGEREWGVGLNSEVVAT